MEKKCLVAVLPYFVVMLLQTRTKLQQGFKGTLTCPKLEISFKCQTKLFSSFQFKDLIPKDLISGAVFSAMSSLPRSIMHLDIRSGKHIDASPVIGKKARRIDTNQTVLFAIIYFITIIYLLLTTLAFWLMRIKSFH